MSTITINGNRVTVEPGDTILEAAIRADIYIPTLCYHPDLPPHKGGQPVEAVYRGETRIENHSAYAPADGIESGCGLCVVERIDTRELVPSCLTQVSEGMRIATESEAVRARRQEQLASIMAGHPHSCLTCAQREGCPRTQCSSNVPENERCCPQFGNCEFQKVAEYVGISPSTIRWVPADIPVLDADPLLTRDYNLCISCTRCVRACRDLMGIEAIGFVFDKDGKVTVGSVAPSLKDSGCIFCTACMEVCPTGAIIDKKLKSAGRDLMPAMRRVMAPPEHLSAFIEENVLKVPAAEGAFRLMDEEKKPIVIKGTANMRELLLEYLEACQSAKHFDYEEDKMFSKRESELLQQHLQKYGEMPSGGEDEDELF
ncbi:MAG: (2Fe-2S)-binding protein [Desulfomonile tiedjei]|nr:(2Fe-2S)-binding protein [Desulfomonile tiedjei]